MGGKISREEDGNTNRTRDSRSYDYESDATSQLSGLYNCADFTLAGQDMFRIDSRVEDSEVESISMYSVDTTDDDASTLMSHSMRQVRSLLGLSMSKSGDESCVTEDDLRLKSIEEEAGTVKTVDSEEGDNRNEIIHKNANLIAIGIVVFVVLLAVILGASLSGSNNEAISNAASVINPVPNPSPLANEDTVVTDRPVPKRTPSPTLIPTSSPTKRPRTADPTILDPTAKPQGDENLANSPLQDDPELRSPASKIVYEMLREYMDDDSRVVDPRTPQGKAFQDLVAAEESQPMRQSYRVIQRYALMTLYYSTNPDSWYSTFGWDNYNFENECGFYGIETCRRSFRGIEVLKLDLADGGLMGTIPEEICLLRFTLEHLNLSSNNLVGNIPSCISGFQNLQTLDLQNNLLSGTLPEGLIFSPSLKNVNLSNNDLKGGLDIVFEGGAAETKPANDLESFNVSNNGLSGTIPSGFASLSNLLELPSI